MSESQTQRKSHRFYAALLVVLTLWMSLPGLSSVQVIDRDEARFAQATVQMVESGDYLNIRNQDKARNKKPAGIYWMQAVFVKALTDPGERQIWTHRIVSVLGALLAVLATYWGALSVLGRRGAFISAAILATTVCLTFEAHIAKTDAMLCGFTALSLACLLRLQKRPSNRTATLFWLSIGSAIMIKGPITPLIIGLAMLSYVIWTKDKAWLRSLIDLPGIIGAMLIVVPWAIAIWIATDGAFFTDSIGKDMGAKIGSGQEGHGAPPGYYLLTSSLLFWPGILFLVPGLMFARIAATNKSGNDDLRRAVRFLICWIVPFWLILELVPTKLVHYPLPLYPALSIFAAGAFIAILGGNNFTRSRRLGAVLFLIAAIILVGGIFGSNAMLAEDQTPLLYVFPLFIGLAFLAAIWMWNGQALKAAISALVLTMILTPITYAHIFPNLTDLRLSDRVTTALENTDFQINRIISPTHTEPSLVYRLGTDTLIAERAEAAIDGGLKSGDVLLIDKKELNPRYEVLNLNSLVADKDHCLKEQSKVDGVNYSASLAAVDLIIYQVMPCK